MGNDVKACPHCRRPLWRTYKDDKNIERCYNCKKDVNNPPPAVGWCCLAMLIAMGGVITVIIGGIKYIVMPFLRWLFT